MATVLYIDPNQATGLPRAAALGCGWVPNVPPQYMQAVGSLPAVVVAGQGIVAIIPDNPPTTTAAIGAALAPILAAEQAARDAATTGAVNQSTLQQQATGALANNRTYLGLVTPTTAQVAAQVRALTQQNQALIRLALQQFDATN